MMIDSKKYKGLNVGWVYKYNSQYVYIVSGQFDTPRGISNHYYWRVVDENGKLSKESYHGYGGSDFKELNSSDFTIETTVFINKEI